MRGPLSQRWMWVGCLLTGCWFLFGPPDAWAIRTDQLDKDITQKNKDLKEIKKEITLTRKKEKEVRGKESSILGNLHFLESELYQKEKELIQMEKPLSQTRERLRQTKHQIVLLSKRMEQTQEELFFRLIALYKMGRVRKEGLLLASQSYPDLLRLDKYL